MEVSCTHKTKTIYSLRCGSRATGCHQMSLCVPSFALSAHHKMWGKLNAMKFVFKGRNNEEWVIEIQCFVLVRTPATEVHTPEPHTPLTDSPVWQQRPSGPSAWCWRSPAGNACSWTEDRISIEVSRRIKEKKQHIGDYICTKLSHLHASFSLLMGWSGSSWEGPKHRTRWYWSAAACRHSLLQYITWRGRERERDSRKERIQVTKRDRYEKIS